MTSLEVTAALPVTVVSERQAASKATKCNLPESPGQVWTLYKGSKAHGLSRVIGVRLKYRQYLEKILSALDRARVKTAMHIRRYTVVT
jgi:hypothetical protein